MSRAREFADLAGSADAGGLTGRNLIINGAMQVAQRGTTASGLSSIGLNTVDRFNGNSATAGSFTLTDEQSSDAPAGFNYSRKLTFTTAQTTSAGTRNQVRHHIEGYNTAHLDWGTADAKTVTLSFWVKSSVTGSMAVAFINQTETHSYVTDYTVSSANTWEYKTIVVEGPTVGAWNTNNTIGIRLSWDLGSGSTYQTPTSDAWVSGWYYRTSSSVRPAETLNATWQITGVQLELGDTATPFEHRSYGDELFACQRYYSHAVTAIGPASSANNFQPMATFPRELRTTPSFSASGAINISDHYVADFVQSSASVSVIANATTGSPAQFLQLTNFSGLTTGRIMFFPRNSSNNNRIIADAEL